ncbi:MAG: hypothetical protein KDK33_05735 [Leptospiraceae bacterium]|nr:hypothetical protein [Leptospiraceae bacterium]
MNRCIYTLVLCIASCFFVTNIYGEKELDPLLRRPWINGEVQFWKGSLSRLQKDRGSVQSEWVIPDTEGRFWISAYGISFEPLESYEVHVPEAAEAPMEMVAADRLFQRGMKAEALRIWNAFAALPALGKLPAFQRKAAIESSSRIARWSQTEDYARIKIGRTTAIYLESGTTMVSNLQHGFRFQLKGRYRAGYFFSQDRSVHEIALRDASSAPLESTVIVSSQSLVPYPSVGQCLAGWDQRIGWTPQRKVSEGFHRKKAEFEGLDESREALLEASIDGKEGAWLEYYAVSGPLCLHIRIISATMKRPVQSLEGALELEGKKNQVQVESYDSEASYGIIRDLYPTLSVGE